MYDNNLLCCDILLTYNNNICIMPKSLNKNKQKKSKTQRTKQKGGVYEHNAGLYGDEQSTGEWASIKVEPSTDNYINNNLKSANPPPQATTQYQGTNRPGNNTQTMEGVVNYTNDQTINTGSFNIKAISGGAQNKKAQSKKAQSKKHKQKNNKNQKAKITLKRRMFKIIG